jgi:hypothetical protein
MWSSLLGMQQPFDIFALDDYNQSDKPSPGGWQFYLQLDSLSWQFYRAYLIKNLER